MSTVSKAHMRPQTPLLLLPGLMNDERVWNPIRPPPTTGRTVITAQTHSADSMAALAIAATAQMPAGRFAVAGFSLGGYVALEICPQADDRIAGIALLDTGARADAAEAKQNRLARAIGTEGFVRQQTAAMNRNDLREVLGDLHCPALVLCGREDQITPPALSEEMAQLLRGDVELVLVPESGHMSTLEQPAAVAEAFGRWLGKVDAQDEA